MIKITKHPQKAILTFLEEATAILTKHDVTAFMDKFDSTCLKQNEIYQLYTILRYGHLYYKRQPIYIDTSLQKINRNKQNIVRTEWDYFVHYKIFSYGIKNNITLNVHFIVDSDMFYVVLEYISYSL